MARVKKRKYSLIAGACVCWQAAEGGGLEAGHMSDATASGPASDDEVSSMAATVGSMLHTSPADHEGGSGAASDSGGSQVDSVSGMMLAVVAGLVAFTVALGFGVVQLPLFDPHLC